MTSKDGTDPNDLPGPLAPDQVTTPPLQHHGASMDNPLVASLINDNPPKSGSHAEAAYDLIPQTPEAVTEPTDPEPAPESPESPEPTEPEPAPQTDPYLKQLSQQFATLGSQVNELRDMIGRQQAPQDPGTAGELEAVQEQAQEQLGDVLTELATLEASLNDRDELDGVEPADLKATIKALGSIVKKVDAIEQRSNEARQAAQQAAQQSSADDFFKAEDAANPGIDSKDLWGKACEEADRYLGQQTPGTPGYTMAQQFAQTRYGEFKQAALAAAGKPPAPTPTPAPSPVKPPAPAGTQPRQDPKGTVTQPPGSRPVATTGTRDTKSIIDGLITP